LALRRVAALPGAGKPALDVLFIARLLVETNGREAAIAPYLIKSRRFINSTHSVHTLKGAFIHYWRAKVGLNLIIFISRLSHIDYI
jgi:hypothetical protein